MSQSVTQTADDLVTLVENVVTHTRPATDAELFQAVNFGIGKVMRAIQAVRPQAFVSFVDPFTIAAGTAEYDLTIYSPEVIRPLRLTIPNGTTPPIIFRYKALMDPEYEARDGRQTSAGSGFFYDILTGVFPQTPFQYSALNHVNGVVTLTGDLSAITAAFPQGSVVLFPGARSDGGDVLATVVALHTPVIHVLPIPAGESDGFGDITVHAVVPVWRRMLRLSPTPATSYAGRLWYDFRPDRIQARTDLLDIQIMAFQDCIVEYALHHLLKGTADAMHRDHLESADALRAELIQDIEPLSNQNSEALSSGLGDD